MMVIGMAVIMIIAFIIFIPTTWNRVPGICKNIFGVNE